MDGELIPATYTYNQARTAINESFSILANLSGLSLKMVVTGSTYGVQSNDAVIVQTGSGSIYLPDPGGVNRVLTIKNYSVSSVNIIPTGGDIDGVPSGATINPNQCITVQSTHKRTR
jgi:hypothetical protein